MTAKEGLSTKLCKVAAACGYIQKSGYNDTQKYWFTRAADVLTKVNEQCSVLGIAVYPDFMIMSEADGLGKSGGTHRIIVKCLLTLTDAETGEERVIAALGSGSDSGDKAVMKAMTAATKYAWLTALTIATGDDPEAPLQVTLSDTAPSAPKGKKVKPPTEMELAVAALTSAIEEARDTASLDALKPRIKELQTAAPKPFGILRASWAARHALLAQTSQPSV